jgi:glycosyltransferase involved in cell wall biosynthesis
VKILHLIAGGINGGAGKGAYTLHKKLLENGIDSMILTNVLIKKNESGINTIIINKFHKYLLSFKTRLYKFFLFFYFNKSNGLFSTGFDGVDLTKNKYFKEADVIHLHWINSLVNIKSLKKVKKPIVWTIRDLWPLTGGCHFHLINKKVCTNFESGCGNCHYLSSKLKYDFSYFIMKNKLNNIPKNIYIVGISNWITDLATRSLLFNNRSIITISNNIDVEIFKPFNKIKARVSLGIINLNRKVILFGGIDANLYHKGIDSFIESLSYLDLNKYFFIFFGNVNMNLFSKFNLNFINFGFINNNTQLAKIYSSADVYISSSYLDSFGKTIAESMACATPVVCFDATGPADIIEHKVSGYKAEPFCSSDLANGIEWVSSLSNENYNNLSESARQRICLKFDANLIALQYINLYSTILK